jgi:hypothetical protein
MMQENVQVLVLIIQKFKLSISLFRIMRVPLLVTFF